MKYPRLLVLIVAAIGLGGCADSDSAMNATVQGTVTVEGELAPRGKVSFHNTGNGPSAYGSVHEDGTFTLRVGQGNVKNQDASRIPAGEYVATVVVNELSVVDPEHPSGPPRPGARLTSAKYSRQETSGLKYTIKAGLNVIDIDVGAPSGEELAAAEAAAIAKSEAMAASEAAKAAEDATGGSEGAENESSGTDAENPVVEDSESDPATKQEASQ